VGMNPRICSRYRITFEKENVRDLNTPSSATSKQGEDIGIGTTYVPTHMQVSGFSKSGSSSASMGESCCLRWSCRCCACATALVLPLLPLPLLPGMSSRVQT
jgi:hypothetical protein